MEVFLKAGRRERWWAALAYLRVKLPKVTSKERLLRAGRGEKPIT